MLTMVDHELCHAAVNADALMSRLIINPINPNDKGDAKPVIQSIQDYENWRDSQYDLPMADLPNESKNSFWKPISADKTDWLYSGSSDEDLQRGCVGHLRGDFGQQGNEFWTSWFNHQPLLNTETFRAEVQDVLNDLRGEEGLLRNRASMSRHCREGLPVEDSYGFQAETENYQYCLRCNPRRVDYNFYLYIYDKHAQREYALSQTAELPVLHETTNPPKTHKTKEMER